MLQRTSNSATPLRSVGRPLVDVPMPNWPRELSCRSSKDRVPGGWADYDIHHIIPLEYGGTDAFENLVPAPRDSAQQEFNTWWRDH